MKQTKPTIMAHPESGVIITPSTSNPEFGTIRVDQVADVFNNGFFATQRRVAFIRGRVSDLEGLVERFKLKEGSTLNGKIIKQESFEPFYTKADGTPQEPKIHPTTNEVILTDGRPTYLNFVYTEDNSASDHWVENELVEEVIENAGEL